MEEFNNPYDEEIKKIPEDVAEQYWSVWKDATGLDIPEDEEEITKEFFVDEILPTMIGDDDELS